ncbi:MAG: DNA-directed RNA polymerase subunit A', partial [Candidatus Nanoarchaeia archaeon]
NLHKKYGEEFTVNIIGLIQKLGIATLQRRGFTTAISDTDLPSDAKKAIQDVLDDAYKRVSKLIAQFVSGDLETFPGKTVSETLELKILESLNKARNLTGEIVNKCATEETGTLVMIRSGARGKLLNLAQMAACVGQQAMRGQRIDNGYRDRTLSCFKRGDLSSPAKGFIRGGFKQGLRPAEFFFMGMTGRDSLMDTALRTPKSGYLYRRLANAMQDLKVEYDYTVRDASKRIVQFMYGEDGIDVSKSENGTVDVKKIVQEFS